MAHRRRRAAGAARPRLTPQRGNGPRVRFAFALLLAAFGAWIFLPVPGLSATVPRAIRPPALPGLPWLSTSHGQIVDTTGRRILLRGFNDEALLESTVNPPPLDASDARLMAAAGFDVVRLPIAWSLLEPHRGVFATSYLNRVAAAVSMLNAHGLYVVLDMHSLGWSPKYGGSGAPDWATVPGVPDPHWGPMPSVGRFLSPAINASTVYFWVTQDWQHEYLRAWQHVAETFRDSSGVAGYDIFNEPHSFPLPPIRFDKDQLFPFYARAIDAIGSVDPNHLFFLDNDMFDAAAGWPTAVVPIAGRNLVYAPHVYIGSLNPPAFSGDPAPLRANIAQLAREAQELPGALWFGEFSIDSHQHLALQWIGAALAAFDAHGAGWAWWQWREDSGYGVRNVAGTALDRTLLNVLARPCVLAAPSGVWGTADVNGDALSIHVEADHGGGAVVASWPGLTRGTPVLTNDCGAVASWDAFTARLTLSVPPGSACTLTLR